MTEAGMVEVFGVRRRYQKIIHHLSPPLYTCFEHKFALGGGSGDSGGIFCTLMVIFYIS
jgi:hypothetical protein